MAFTAHANLYDREHQVLLSMDGHSQHMGSSAWTETIKTAPIFTSGAGKLVDEDPHLPGYEEFGLLGQQLELMDPHTGAGSAVPQGDDSRVFLNGNAPLSAFICGVQGAGKSNSLACMLENFLLPSPNIGELPAPLTALVFHYDQHTSAACEAAYLASHVPVTVLVPPSSLQKARVAYANLPGANRNLLVRALTIREEDMDISRMLTLMAVDKTDDKPPLYMEVVRKVLRGMASSKEGFQYQKFKKQLDNQDLSPGQRGPLNLRLEILESFMPKSKAEKKDLWRIGAGRMVVVDLSDPFVDEGTACSLFDICLNLFLDRPSQHGRVVALDEAHKYMTGTAAAVKFTDTILSTIRQQRHLGTRILISTQEPTISPKLLDLCSFTLCHRFTSPEWLSFLKAHIAAAGQEDDRSKMMARIVALDSGEAFLFAPSGIVEASNQWQSEDWGDAMGQLSVADGEPSFGDGGETRDVDPFAKRADYASGAEARAGATSGSTLEKLGLRYFKVKIRKRITEDGGKSVLAVG